MLVLKTISFYLILLLPLLSLGQQENLILNGSLEDFYSCPFESDATITKAKYWNAGVPGGISSTDYYHGCAGLVPSNNSFYQNAKDGVAFFGAGYGLVPFNSSAIGIREFASGTLKECLKPLKRYQLSFSVCPPLFNGLATLGFDCFEVYFHPNQFPFSAENLGVISRFHEVADKVVVMPVASPIVNTTVWHKLTVEFVAQGDECFFTIGCFKKILAQNVGALDSTQPNVNVQFGVSYFYDDFVLTEIPDDTTPEPTPEPVVPNVLTPNGDGINDFWVVENLPPGTAVAIYNRWGQQVYFTENYSNDWGGEGLPAGNYIAELVFRDLPPRRLAIYLIR